MALTKVTYTNNVTVIEADNLNEIQDAIIEQQDAISTDETDVTVHKPTTFERVITAPQVLNYFSQISSNASRTFTVPNSTRGIILLQRGSNTDGTNGLYSLVSTSTGGVYTPALSAISDVTFNRNTNSLTITNNGANIYMSYMGNNMIEG